MKNNIYVASLGLCLCSLGAMANEKVDVLFYVEPQVYNSVDREELNNLIQNQIDIANGVHANQSTGISYQGVAVLDWKNNEVSEKLEQGKSFGESLGDVMYSIPYTEAQYNVEFADHPWFTHYHQEAHDLIRQYSADNVVFISASKDSNRNHVGYGFLNFGVVVSIGGLLQNDYLLAHEWGHNIGLGHTDETECSQKNYIMCATNGSGQTEGFNLGEVDRINGVVNNDPDYVLEHFIPEFRLGDFSNPMPIHANVYVKVLDNPIEEDLNETEVVIELMDSDNNAVVFDDELSLELYSESGTAKAGEHFDKGIYQRVTFAPGESVKRLNLGVTHSSSDVSFKLGARYGLNLSDSEAVSITVKAKADNGGNNGGDSGSSGGGSMGFISLLMLTGLSLVRKNQ